MKQSVKIGGFGRFLSGEGIFKAIWTNTTSAPGFVSLTPNLPGSVIPIDLDRNGGSFRCKRDAFMAAVSPDVKISIAMLNTDSCLGCCCSGMDMFMQDIRGTGMVFIQGNGTIMEKELAPGEEIVVDTNRSPLLSLLSHLTLSLVDSVVGVGGAVSVDVVRTGGCSAMCCSGEGCVPPAPPLSPALTPSFRLFNTTLKGPGRIIICSMPLEKLRALFPRPQKREKADAGAAAAGMA
jgi:uncharacterized protein (AIM24 family)